MIQCKILNNIEFFCMNIILIWTMWWTLLLFSSFLVGEELFSFFHHFRTERPLDNTGSLKPQNIWKMSTTNGIFVFSYCWNLNSTLDRWKKELPVRFFKRNQNGSINSLINVPSLVRWQVMYVAAHTHTISMQLVDYIFTGQKST